MKQILISRPFLGPPIERKLVRALLFISEVDPRKNQKNDGFKKMGRDPDFERSS